MLSWSLETSIVEPSLSCSAARLALRGERQGTLLFFAATLSGPASDERGSISLCDARWSFFGRRRTHGSGQLGFWGVELAPATLQATRDLRLGQVA